MKNKPSSSVHPHRKCTVVNISVERNIPRYVGRFLHHHYVKNRVCCYLERDVRDTLLRVVKRIGDNKVTLTAYIDNILREHLSEHKSEINRISRENADVL